MLDTYITKQQYESPLKIARKTLERLGSLEESKREHFSTTPEFKELIEYLKPFHRNQAIALFGDTYYTAMELSKSN